MIWWTGANETTGQAALRSPGCLLHHPRLGHHLHLHQDAAGRLHAGRDHVLTGCSWRCWCCSSSARRACPGADWIARWLSSEWKFMAAGLCGVTLYFLFQNIALSYTLAANVSVLISVAPLFTALVSRGILHEKLKSQLLPRLHRCHRRHHPDCLQRQPGAQAQSPGRPALDPGGAGHGRSTAC